MDKIIVIDFGSQYSQLIVRKLRSLHVYCELYPYDMDKNILNDRDIKGIILSGGPKSVYDLDSYQLDKVIFDLGLPILGICYGMQLIADHFGGKVVGSDTREYGKKSIEILDHNSLFLGLKDTEQVWMSHGDYVSDIGPNLEILATSDGIISSIQHKTLKIYGTQFHLEVNHTINGMHMLENFIQLCQIEATWYMNNYIEMAVKDIKETVGNDKVLMAISGGVDSSVAANLIHLAIKDNLTCLFIDHGLLRLNEAEKVMSLFKDTYHIHVVKVDARDYFLSKLKGISDPEQKRKIIGDCFIKTFEQEARKFGDYAYLGQGTLYTDVIESGTKTAEVIKSHHNVGGLPKDMSFKLLEPLNKLFKDEVRDLGLALNMDERLIKRQPFPGPGLAIRILGEITNEKIRIVQETDHILDEEIKKANLNQTIWQYFTVCTDSLSVGVMGDKRSYEYVLAIRAVTSKDGMTADWARIPYDVLEVISRRMVNEVKGINRIVLDVTSKPPATIEWE